MKRLFVLVPALALFAGCGTLFTPSTKSISLSSSPVEAQVIIDGSPRGVTPLTLDLSNRETHVIEFQKEGYESIACTLNASVKGSIVVLDILGGLVPVIVDAVTGDWKTLEKDFCNVSLREK